MTETPAFGSRRTAPNGAGEFNDVLDRLVAVRGVEAAAIVGVDGEFLEGRAVDDALLERMVSTVTSALAAGEALAGLLESPKASGPVTAVEPDGGDVAAGGSGTPGAAMVHEDATAADDGDAHGLPEVDDTDDTGDAGSAQHQLMVMYQDGGPILFTPLANGECVAVVALGSSHDIGRVRFRLRGLTAAGGRP